MLGGLGVACGLVLAVAMRGLLARLLPAEQQIDLRMDAQVLGASVLAGLAAAVFLAIVTAWQSHAWQSTGWRSLQAPRQHAGVACRRSAA